MEKQFVSAEQLLTDSFELALRIFESGLRPTYVIGIWRGGAPIGIAVQEVLETLKCPTDHFAIRASSYGGGKVQADHIEVRGLECVINSVGTEDKILIVDDVFDSGRTIDTIIERLEASCGSAIPRDIRIATVYFKPTRNLSLRTPDYFIHKTDAWTVFPHELRGCSEPELRANKSLPDRFYSLLSATNFDQSAD